MTHLRQRLGCRLTSLLGTARENAAYCNIVILQIDHTLTYRQSDLEYILGKLLLKVTVAYGTIGIRIAILLHHFRSRSQFQQREQILHRLAYRLVRFFRTLIGNSAHHLLAQCLLIINKIYAVAFALAHLAGSVKTRYLDRFATEIKVRRFGEQLHIIE